MAPVLVLLGLVVGQPMDLVFQPLEIAAVGVAVGISALIALDGESNWLEGALLMLIYLDHRDLVLRAAAADRGRLAGRATAREGGPRRRPGTGVSQAATASSRSSSSSSSSSSPAATVKPDSSATGSVASGV